MTGTIQALQNTDLLALTGRDTTLKKVSSTNGGEWAGPCPFCGGRDRFRVWPNADRPSWWCRQCKRNGDAIAYLVERGKLTPQEAGRLRRDTQVSAAPFAEEPRPKPQGRLPSETWQSRGREFVAYCQGRLWDETGAKALAWLQRRGLQPDTARYFGLGYNPADWWDEPPRWGLEGKRIWLPRGVVIPCEVNGVLWYVKIRRPSGKPKYVQVRGSKSALFDADDLGNENRLLLLCEGEFDAMLAKQEAGDLVDVAALCGAARGIPVRWLPYFLPYARVLVAYDGDEAGRKGAAKLAVQSRRVIRIAVADGGDLTDFYTSGGDLRGWLAGEVEEHALSTHQEVGW